MKTKNIIANSLSRSIACRLESMYTYSGKWTGQLFEKSLEEAEWLLSKVDVHAILSYTATSSSSLVPRFCGYSEVVLIVYVCIDEEMSSCRSDFLFNSWSLVRVFTCVFESLLCECCLDCRWWFLWEGDILSQDVIYFAFKEANIIFTVWWNLHRDTVLIR